MLSPEAPAEIDSLIAAAPELSETLKVEKPAKCGFLRRRISADRV